MPSMNVPFFRVYIEDPEIREVEDVLRSGWLTTGSRVKRFEKMFKNAVGASNALAVNSCTAALHLAVEAMDLGSGDGVLVPTHTFASTAEVVRYCGAVPVLVDCDPVTLNMDLDDAQRKITAVRRGELARAVPADTRIVGMIPVHVAGYMMNLERIDAFTEKHGIWYVEDAAHAFPAALRSGAAAEWRQCGSGLSRAACFSFYANKTITTGEGGMVITGDGEMADRMRRMSLHGLSKDAWSRYSGGASWDYRIIAPGFKYNMTDIAAAVGIHQLDRAESLRRERERIAGMYDALLADVNGVSVPMRDANRLHSWHLYPIRLNLEAIRITRNEFVACMRTRGVGFSVHWRPLHLHPYYETRGWRAEDCSVATDVWARLVSLPLFAGMRDEEVQYVAEVIREIVDRHSG